MTPLPDIDADFDSDPRIPADYADDVQFEFEMDRIIEAYQAAQRNWREQRRLAEMREIVGTLEGRGLHRFAGWIVSVFGG